MFCEHKNGDFITISINSFQINGVKSWWTEKICRSGEYNVIINWNDLKASSEESNFDLFHKSNAHTDTHCVCFLSNSQEKHKSIHNGFFISFLYKYIICNSDYMAYYSFFKLMRFVRNWCWKIVWKGKQKMHVSNPPCEEFSFFSLTQNFFLLLLLIFVQWIELWHCVRLYVASHFDCKFQNRFFIKYVSCRKRSFRFF